MHLYHPYGSAKRYHSELKAFRMRKAISQFASEPPVLIKSSKISVWRMRYPEIFINAWAKGRQRTKTQHSAVDVRE